MSKVYIDIKSGIGLGDIKFGVSREDLKGLIGEPDEVENYTLTGDEEDQTESWHYDELELSVSFLKKDAWKLVSLTSSSEDSIFKGIELIGLSQKQLKEELSNLAVKDLQFEDCSSEETPNLELVYSMQEGMNFWLEEGVVTDVEWGVKYLSEEEIDWPK